MEMKQRKQKFFSLQELKSSYFNVAKAWENNAT